MKTKLTICLWILSVLLFACKEKPVIDDPILDEKISLTPISLELKVGEMGMIDAGSARNVVWSSSDDSVASVYAGVVEAHAIGRAIITAKSGEQSATCVVYVKSIVGTTLRITPLRVSLEVGETYQMKSYNTYAMPETWISSNTDAVTVSDQGLVTAVAPGVSVITVKTEAEEVTAIVSVNHHWGDYHLVWSDEFDGTELNRNTWNIEQGGGGWGNNELQYYTDRSENLRVENGYLVIEARKETYQNREYTSARLQSRGKKEFLYGKVEARIKFPGGGGTWPAFWMMGNKGGWPSCGEIDIQEHVGNMTKRASFALHSPKRHGGSCWSKTTWFDYDLAEDFHIYGVEWCREEENGKDVIRFMVDNVVYAECWGQAIDGNDAWPWTKPHYIIFNCAIGGNMGGRVDDSIFEQQRLMLVDWVRVYQREEAL